MPHDDDDLLRVYHIIIIFFLFRGGYFKKRGAVRYERDNFFLSHWVFRLIIFIILNLVYNLILYNDNAIKSWLLPSDMTFSHHNDFKRNFKDTELFSFVSKILIKSCMGKFFNAHFTTWRHITISLVFTLNLQWNSLEFINFHSFISSLLLGCASSRVI